MSKAPLLSACANAPARRSILEMIRRHRELYRLTDDLYAAGGDAAADGAESCAAIAEAVELEYLIAATVPACAGELEAKDQFLDDDVCGCLDRDRLIATILEVDAERIAAAT